MALLIHDKVDGRTKNFARDIFKSHFIMINVSVHPENLIILNVYVPYNKASKYMKPKLIEL